MSKSSNSQKFETLKLWFAEQIRLGKIKPKKKHSKKDDE